MASPCIYSSSSDGLSIIRDLSTKNVLVQYKENSSIVRGTAPLYGSISLDTPPTIDFLCQPRLESHLFMFIIGVEMHLFFDVP